MSLQRFFLDDGKSRKAWQIERQGARQTVRFGRLGSALRDSVKTFASDDKARQDTERLIASKRKSGYVEVDPTLLEIHRPRGAKSANEKGVLAFEKSLGARLPDEYRAFLLDANGGELRTGFIRTPGVPGVANVSVDVLFGLQPPAQRNSLQAAITRHGPVLPQGRLPVAAGNDLFTLCLTAKRYGSIEFWNHESESLEEHERFRESDGHVIAGSFDEFLTRIARFHDIDAEPATGKGKSQRKSGGKPSWRRLFSMLDKDLYDLDASPKRVAAEIEAQGGDLSGIEEGAFPFQNIRNVAVLRTLLDAKLDPDTVDVEGHPLLWLAAGHPACVDLLVKAGANLEQRTSDRETALIRAVFVESKEGLRKLLSLGANPTVRMTRDASCHLQFNKPLAAILNKAKANWSG